MKDYRIVVRIYAEEQIVSLPVNALVNALDKVLPGRKEILVANECAVGKEGIRSTRDLPLSDFDGHPEYKDGPIPVFLTPQQKR